MAAAIRETASDACCDGEDNGPQSQGSSVKSPNCSEPFSGVLLTASLVAAPWAYPLAGRTGTEPLRWQLGPRHFVPSSLKHDGRRAHVRRRHPVDHRRAGRLSHWRAG